MKLVREDKGYTYLGLTQDGLFKFRTPYGDIEAYESIKFLRLDGEVYFGDFGDYFLHLSYKKINR